MSFTQDFSSREYKQVTGGARQENTLARGHTSHSVDISDPIPTMLLLLRHSAHHLLCHMPHVLIYASILDNRHG